MSRVLEFAANHWLLVTALVVILVLLVRSFLSERISGVKSVPIADAVNLVNRENALVLDVRTEQEYEQGHILDSLNIPLGLLDQNIKQLGEDRERPILVVCRSGQRSARAAGILKKHGFNHIYNLAGGLMAWEKEGLPLHKGKKFSLNRGREKERVNPLGVYPSPRTTEV